MFIYKYVHPAAQPSPLSNSRAPRHPRRRPHGWRLLLPAPPPAPGHHTSAVPLCTLARSGRIVSMWASRLPASLSTWNMQGVVFKECPPPPSSSKSSFVASPFRAGVSFLLPLPLGRPCSPQHLVEATQCHHIPGASAGPQGQQTPAGSVLLVGDTYECH